MTAGDAARGWRRMVVSGLVGLALAGCSSTPTRVDTGSIRAASFSFVANRAKATPGFADSREPLHAMIQDSISRNLAAKGLNKVASGGDLTVAYITGNGLKTQEAVIDAVGRPVRIQPSLVAFEKTFKMGKNGGGDS